MTKTRLVLKQINHSLYKTDKVMSLSGYVEGVIIKNHKGNKYKPGLLKDGITKFISTDWLLTLRDAKDTLKKEMKSVGVEFYDELRGKNK